MARLIGSSNGRISYVVSDIDETLYTNREYTFFRGQRELEGAVKVLRVSMHTVREMIGIKAAELRDVLGREVTRTETVSALGIPGSEWEEIRYQTWQPKMWLRPDPELCQAVETFQRESGIKVCFATNAPGQKGAETLEVLGFPKDSFPFFCPETLGYLKPDLQFFLRIAQELEVAPDLCTAIGDRQMSDVDPALKAGFSCGFVVQGRDDFLSVLFELKLRERSA